MKSPLSGTRLGLVLAGGLLGAALAAGFTLADRPAPAAASPVSHLNGTPAEVPPMLAPPAEVPQSLALPAAPAPPTPPATPGDGNININVGGGKPSSSITIMIALTVLSMAPALLLLCTAFTKIFVVLGITRNALGLSNVPPNQVIAGLALFLSLFVMGPTVSDVNAQGVQPYLKGTKSQSVAFHDGVQPLRQFMLKHTRKDELALLTKVANRPLPKNQDDVPLTTLIPAFTLSELRAAFIIGFVIFIPFLIIDMVVSATLMSLGMMMLPPVTVSLPFKLLLFVLVNGWGLVITALVSSYQG
jgi:flagellar biosynthetic protein FliP